MRTDHTDKYNAEADAFYDATVAMIAQMRKELAFLEHVERVTKLVKDRDWQATDVIVPDDARIPSMFRPKVESSAKEEQKG